MERESMTETAESPVASRQFMLPVLVFGLVEVRRLRREVEALEEFMRSSELRSPGIQPALPRVSRLLDALATDNHCSLLQTDDRRQLSGFLHAVETQAPTLHISFASDPSSAFLSKVVRWLRVNVHPAVLVQIGLQPTLAAGCIVRTMNKQFDFSLRDAFTRQKPLLLQALAQEAPSTAVPTALPVADAHSLEQPAAEVLT